MQLSQGSRAAIGPRRDANDTTDARPTCTQPQRVSHAQLLVPASRLLAPVPCRRGKPVAVAAAAPPAPAPQNQQEDLPSSEVSAFAALGVDPALVAGLARADITSPSPIQSAAIPAILAGGNVAFQSYTGSGKTLAYLLPVLSLALQRAERIYRLGNGREVPVQAVVVAPSQELAMQVVRVAQSLLPPQGRTMVQQCIGGANPRNQLLALEKNKPLVVVGTPGRLSEFMRTGALRVHSTPLLVLDEADQLLAPQFAEDMTSLTAVVGKRLGPRPARRTPITFGDHDAPSPSHPSPSPSHLSPSPSHPSPSLAPTPAPLSGDDAVTREKGEGVVAGEEEGGEQVQWPQARQTVVASATLSQTVLSQMQVWCPNPAYVTAGGPAPVLAPPEEMAHPADADAPDAPGWGWGVRGWDGPANSLGPRGQGSAGGVEGEGLVPSMPPHIKHYVMVVDQQRKVDSLRRAMHALDLQRSLVFMNWQQRLKDVQFKLEARSMKVAVLHGEMPKVARQNVLNDFVRGRLRALVVSDVVARGLDVPNCDAVFHLELPSSASHYAHRAGRTGRMGAPGTVISVVGPSDVWVVDKLAHRLGVEIQEVHVANGQFLMGPPPETRNKQQQDTGPTRGEESTQQGQGAASASSTPPTPTGRTAAADSQSADRKAWEAASGQQKPSGLQGPTAATAARPAGGVAAAGRSGVSGGVSGAGSRATGGSGEQALPKGARAVEDVQGEFERIIYDDEDEIELVDGEEEELEEQLSQLRAEAGGGSRGGRGGGRGGAAGAQGQRGSRAARRAGLGAQGAQGQGQGKAGPVPEYVKDSRGVKKGHNDNPRFGASGEASVRKELSLELEELRAEKAALRAKRFADRQEQE